MSEYKEISLPELIVNRANALQRHGKNEARVVPVILRRCLWDNTPFSKLQALPKDGRAIASWPDRDEALVNVAEGIRDIAHDLLNAHEED